MGRKPRPLPLDFSRLAAWQRNFRRAADLIRYMQTRYLVCNAVDRKELSPPVGALFELKSLLDNHGKRTFDMEGYRRLLSSEEQGSIEVPKRLLVEIVDSWSCYRSGEYDTLDRAFGADGAGSNHSARRVVQDLEDSLRWANLIFEKRAEAQLKGEIISLSEARKSVLADFRNDEHPEKDEPVEVSDRTLQRAWKRWGPIVEMLGTIGLRPE